MAILLISNADDAATNKVIDWVVYFQKQFIRLTFDHFLNGLTIDYHLLSKEENLFIAKSRGKKINIESAWFRSDSSNYNINFPLDNHFSEVLNKHLTFETRMLKRVLYASLKKTRWLSSFETTQLNKLSILRLAKEIGLSIPETFITNNRDILKRKIKKYGTLISKSACENLVYIQSVENSIVQYAEEINDINVEEIPESFYPSLFQRKIPKEYDIRMFFLNGECLSMAIFNKCIDFRSDYSSHRNVPIKLPNQTEKLVNTLMNRLNLNTGSLDFVKSTEDGGFYFLEVNPNGQFEMVSDPCNYYIERKIAKFLCNES